MRKVTRTIVEAFYSGVAKTSGNTCTDGNNVWLHGNKIAEKDELGNLLITNAGFETNVTKERLNGLLQLGNFPQWPAPHIYQKNFTWYLSVGGHNDGRQRTLEFPCNGWVNVESEIDKAYKHEAVQ